MKVCKGVIAATDSDGPHKCSGVVIGKTKKIQEVQK